MMIREPVVAGRFYPAQAERCRADLEDLLESSAPPGDLCDAPLLGGLVPHAGWMCSGRTAAKVFAALAASRRVEVFVLFSGVHRYRGREAALFASGQWETPLGPVEVDSRLAERILGHTNLIVEDPYAHEEEHSLEVQLPFVRRLFPEARIVPLMVPITTAAPEVGQAVARTLTAYDYDAIILGTTDLTHYGPSYGFVPQGVGAKANAWAKQANDRPFIDLVCQMRADDLVPEATVRKSACNSGATAATVACVRELGATEGVLLEHTTSSEVLAGAAPQELTDSVGYAGIVFK
jgi:AmmeMemoRadiSam system protein B